MDHKNKLQRTIETSHNKLLFDALFVFEQFSQSLKSHFASCDIKVSIHQRDIEVRTALLRYNIDNTSGIPGVAPAAEKRGCEKKKIGAGRSGEIDGETCDTPGGKGQLRIQRIDRIALDRGIMDRRVAEMQVRRGAIPKPPSPHPGYIFHRYDR